MNKSKLNWKEYSIKMHVFSLEKQNNKGWHRKLRWKWGYTDCYCTEAKRLGRVSKLHRKNAFGLQNINHPWVSIRVTRRIHWQTGLPTTFFILEHLTELRGQWPYVLPSCKDQTHVSEMCLIPSCEAPAGAAALN